MLISWYFDRKSAEAALWAIGYSCICCGQMLQALRGIAAESIGTGIGVFFILFGVGLIWIGFRAFDHFSRPYLVAFLQPLVWLLLYFTFPQFYGVPNNRILLFSILIVSQLCLILWSVWQGWKKERLPMRILLIVIGIMYGVLTILRIPMSIFYPVIEVNGISSTSWFGVVMFILYCNSLGMCFGVFALCRERSLRQYKLASETDGLTGVLNRRAFYDRVDKKYGEAGGAVALIDIDHFKSVNDRYGHAAGDEVLRRFTAIVTELLRDDMVFCRMGGEEFGLFVPASRAHKGTDFCETLRMIVSHTPVVWRDEMIKITISIGIYHTLDAGKGLDTGLMQADTLLYQAKDQGRNCVVAGYGANDSAVMRPLEIGASRQTGPALWSLAANSHEAVSHLP